MVKEPRPGRVKTRLARDIGAVSAAWWFRHQCALLFRRIRDPRWHIVLAVSPDRAGLMSRVWPADLPRVPQGEGDLGDRMARLLRSLGPSPVIVIGADIPGITRAQLVRALRRLRAADAVIGPARDGGYWLIGWHASRRPPKSLFEGVRWSTSDALADTLETLGGCRIAFADTLSDVDNEADLVLT